MNLEIQSIHFDADQKLLDYIEKKVEKLSTFNDTIINGTVFLKLDPNREKGNKVVEIKLLVNGQNLFAEEQAITFEAATDLVFERMKSQVIKHKEKLKSL